MIFIFYKRTPNRLHRYFIHGITFKTSDQTKNMIIKKPNGSISIYALDNLSGNTPMTTREPSRGGIGMRLKTPSITLIKKSVFY